MIDQGSSRKFIWSVVTAQVLVQIGAFSLPALLPGYIDQWHLTKTEAGSLVGIFFAAYVVAVPVLVALTDRVAGAQCLCGWRRPDGAIASWLCVRRGWLLVGTDPASSRRYRLGRGLHAWTEGHRGYIGRQCTVARGCCACGGRGRRQRKLLRRRRLDCQPFWTAGGIPVRRNLCPDCHRDRAGVMPNRPPEHSRSTKPARAARLPSRVSQSRRDGLDCRIYVPHLGDGRAEGVGSYLPHSRGAEADAPTWLPTPTVLFTLAGFVGIVVSIFGNEMSQRFGRKRIVTVAMTTSAALAICTGWTVGSSALLAVALVICVACLHLPRQLGAHVRHGAGRRSRDARRHHGPAQHVRLCRRIHRAARSWVCARYGRAECCSWLGPRVRPTSHHFDRRFDFRATVGVRDADARG